MIRKTLGLSAALLIVSCSDALAPVDRAVFRETGSSANAPVTTIVQSAEAPALATYHTSFIAIQGMATRFEIRYLNGDKFIELRIPEDAQFLEADGSPVVPGETVEVTVDVDSSFFLVRFGLQGLRFDGEHPGTLTFFCDHSQDCRGERLSIWNQARSGDSWNPQTNVNLPGHELVATVSNFSNYAVAW